MVKESHFSIFRRLGLRTLLNKDYDVIAVCMDVVVKETFWISFMTRR